RLDRATAAELKGEAAEVTVTRAKEMPVAEILRRLQAFEDNQERRLDHYQAVNTTHLRFHLGASSQTIEATFEGAFFYRQGEGFDWAWQHFLINGVRWRGKKIPEIPLIQPEKAAAMPLAIHFSKRYSYRLRGSERIEGRDCWVVDFQPTSTASAEKGRLYRGTVWIDKQVYARVKTRALQLGLSGDVLSNDETTLYSPVDRQGRPATWSPASYVLPLKVLGQQILSVLNGTTVVEKETDLSQVIVNGSDFSARREQVLSSDSTMVHDTNKGLRYLVKEKGKPGRVVKEGYKKTKLFALGGAFYDSSLSYPLPLAGINYLSFDFRGTGNQLNVFFAGALLTANLAQPHLFGSNFDFGGSVFALGIAGTDNYYQGSRELPAQEVEVRPASASLKLGHPLGSFTKVNLTYQLDYDHYQRSSNTAPGFVLPASHFTHSLSLNLDFSRSGYGLGASVSRNRRSRWAPWGFAGNSDYSPDKRDFTKWGALASKNWYLSKFQRVSAEIDYDGGSNLDRFSKYSFGFFSPTRVHGYPSNRVRASEVEAAHLSYGFEIGQLFRLDLVGDAAWATDKETDLKHQILAGTGLVGTFMGPWQTVVNLDVGFPVAGPANGVVAYVVFLKLFR
ncbi:MAG TPA: hypothetical protein VKA53_11300, partial [Thermoanaerobaculia bacterium]|nr:hypothetical protein [Thermoanaerobaculia bacterium]